MGHLRRALLRPARWLLDVDDDADELERFPSWFRRGPAVVEPPPDPGPLVLELEPVYANGATGALVRLELAETEEARVPVPAGAAAFRVRVVHRAGIYAGASLIADKPNELSTVEASHLFRGMRR